MSSYPQLLRCVTKKKKSIIEMFIKENLSTSQANDNKLHTMKCGLNTCTYLIGWTQVVRGYRLGWHTNYMYLELVWSRSKKTDRATRLSSSVTSQHLTAPLFSLLSANHKSAAPVIRHRVGHTICIDLSNFSFRI